MCDALLYRYGHGNDAYLAQFVQSARQLRQLEQKIARRLGAGALKTGFVSRGKRDESAAMQLQQRFAAANLFKFAVGCSPVEPLANTQRQSTSGQRRISTHRRFDSRDHILTELATTYPHAPLY